MTESISKPEDVQLPQPVAIGDHVADHEPTEYVYPVPDYVFKIVEE